MTNDIEVHIKKLAEFQMRHRKLRSAHNSKRKPVMVSKSVSKRGKSTSNNLSAAGAKVHTVQSGDSLWTISRKYPGINIENLREWNGISGNNLKPGTKLKLCDYSS